MYMFYAINKYIKNTNTNAFSQLFKFNALTVRIIII
jgi:hypothetical protein